MPQIKSAQKRVRQASRRTARNQHAKRQIRLTGQRLKRAVADGDKTAVAVARAELDSRLDRAIKKNLLPASKGGRKKSQAARLARTVTAWSAPRTPAAKSAGSKRPTASSTKPASTTKTAKAGASAKKSAAKPATKTRASASTKAKSDKTK